MANTRRLRDVHATTTTTYRFIHVIHSGTPLVKAVPARNQRGRLVITPNTSTVNRVTSMNENDRTQVVGAATRNRNDAAIVAANSPTSPDLRNPTEMAITTSASGYDNATTPPSNGEMV